jgi:glycosyltransferase involved in cell wall biosynthesis
MADPSASPPIELSLIIPAYNEAAIILRNVEEVGRWMAEKEPQLAYEIVVVDDGSTDGMGELLDECARTDPRLRVAHHNGNRGRGRAIRTGFEQSAGRYVICLDADLSYSPDHIPALLEPLRSGRADITLASAYHPEGQVTNVPLTRALMSKWGNRVLSVGLRGKFRTVTCVVRGYTRDVLNRLELINDGKDLHLEIIQKAELFGLRVVEVPAHLKWRDRDRGKKRKTRLIDYIPFLSMSGTIASHLSYNYVLRPGAILNIPVIALLLAAVLGTLQLLFVFIDNLFTAPGALSFYKIVQILRETLIHGQLTLSLTVGALVISMVFIAFYFASQQNKKNYEELYTLLSRVNDRLKKLEETRDR